MKKVTMLILLAVVGAMSYAVADEPIARITDKVAVIAATGTAATNDVWLNVGSDTPLITPTSTEARTGAGIVRALMYNVTAATAGTVTNGAITFYAYDRGVKKTLYGVSGIHTTGSARYDLTTNVYSGRLHVEIAQDATNSAVSWAWAAIVE